MKHRRHFYFLSALVLTVLSGLLLDGPIYVLTVFLLQMLLACIITVVRHRNIDQWFYDHVESTYFLISIFVGVSLLYLSIGPFLISTTMSHVQLLLFFILPGAALATSTTWYAARHMHHHRMTKKDVIGVGQVSILLMLTVFALNMLVLDTLIVEPWYETNYDELDLLLNQEGLQNITFIQDVTTIYQQQRAVLEPLSVDPAAYDPLCVFSDCLNARFEGYRLGDKVTGLHQFVFNAVYTVREIDARVNETNLSHVHTLVTSNFVADTQDPTVSFWRLVISQYDEAGSFALRGYTRLLQHSRFGYYLFKIQFRDTTFAYQKMMELNVTESQLSQTYRYHFLSRDFY